MRQYYKYIVLTALLLDGCETFLGKKDKIPLEGTREAVLLSTEEYNLDDSLKNHSVKLDAPEANQAWPMAGGNARHVMPPLLLNSDFKLVWQQDVGQGSSSEHRLLNGPIAAENHVYTIDSIGLVSAINLTNGEKEWETYCIPTDSSSQPFGGGLAYDQGKLYAATAHAEILSIDAKTGKILWRFPTSAPVRAAPTVSEGKIFVITINNQLEVFNANDGQILWTHTGIVESAGLLGGASPAVHTGVIVAPYSSGEVFALRIENGYPLWSETLQANKQLDSVSALSHIKARPIIDKNLVFLVSHSGRISALDMRSGQSVWSRDIGGIRTPAVSDKYLFMLTNDNHLVCLMKDTGQIIWSQQLEHFLDQEKQKGKVLWAGPIIINDTLLVTGSNKQGLLLSSLNGKEIKKFELPNKSTLSPIVINKTLLILLDNGTLVAYQ
ncbi:MAG: hypothetical protein BGO76_07990 [Caedibacter sp. 38-128]|nr:PQQ-like beta-propeller repeat protein [Holosporales bacterium]OJX03249.1 MAG: hypothetical protein BGO76_07990 [Caedibacter sp. 38-128]